MPSTGSSEESGTRVHLPDTALHITHKKQPPALPALIIKSKIREVAPLTS